MIVILCSSFYEAESDFEIFLQMTREVYGEESIVDYSKASLYVDTDDDLRFIFVDYRYEPLFRKMDSVDIVNSGDFFNDIIYNTGDWFYPEIC